MPNETRMNQTETEIELMNVQFNSEECYICYAPQRNKASPRCGRHVFCRSCLSDWSKKRNICPVCVQEFEQLVYVKDDGNTEVERVSSKSAEVAERNLEPDGFIPYPYWNPYVSLYTKLLLLTFLFLTTIFAPNSAIQLGLAKLSFTQYIVFVYILLFSIVLSGFRLIHDDELGAELVYKPLLPSIDNLILALLMITLRYTELLAPLGLE